MIFQHTWGNVLKGTKWQTRRLVKEGEDVCVFNHHIKAIMAVGRTSENRLRFVYEVGRTYAVQPGRGKRAIFYRYVFDRGEGPIITLDDLNPDDPCRNWTKGQLIAAGWIEARIKIQAIWRQDVRDISYVDVQSEGFSYRVKFWKMWCEMHDKPALPFPPAIREHLSTRPAERYQAWVLTFMLV